MTENNNPHHIRRNSSRKCHSPTNSSLLQNQTSISSPNSPTNKRNSSRSRQLWNMAVESVLEHEKTPPISLSMVSSTVGNDPNGWYNLTKR